MRHAAAELCLLVSQGAHDRIRQALHLAADNCTLARFPKAVESSRWLDGGRGWGARAGGMTGLDRHAASFVCQPEFHGQLDWGNGARLLSCLGIYSWVAAFAAVSARSSARLPVLPQRARVRRRRAVQLVESRVLPRYLT